MKYNIILSCNYHNYFVVKPKDRRSTANSTEVCQATCNIRFSECGWRYWTHISLYNNVFLTWEICHIVSNFEWREWHVWCFFSFLLFRIKNIFLCRMFYEETSQIKRIYIQNLQINTEFQFNIYKHCTCSQRDVTL
jgi:hypothetical protein